MQTPDYPDNSNSAVARDEAEHAEAQEPTVEERLEDAEDRVARLEGCIKEIVLDRRRMGKQMGDLWNQDRGNAHYAGGRQVALMAVRCVEKYARTYNVSLPKEDSE